MEEKTIKFQSSYGGCFESICIKQNSDILVIMLPGSGYVNTKPLLYYSNKTSIELGFDTLCLNYGFQIFNKDFNINNNEEILILVRESEEIIKQCMDNEYRKIVFIGKSLGTIIQSELSRRFNSYNQVHIYLTPVDKTLENLINYPCLIVSGTEDKKIKKSNFKKLKDSKNIEVFMVDGGNHSLEAADTVKNIETLGKVIKKLKEFLIANK